MVDTPWLAYCDLKPESLVRMFCVPYGGGGASIYRAWENSLPDWVNVCPVQLPGRETRTHDERYRRLPPLVTELVASLKPYIDRPYVLFGHSLGALICFEFARCMRRQGLPGPHQLIASACPAPRAVRSTPRYLKPEPQLAEELARLGGTPAALLNNKDFLGWYLSTFRADCEMYETYVYDADEPLSCPLTVYRGSDDVEVSCEESQLWRDESVGPFVMRTFVGGHLFLQSQQLPLLRQLSADVSWLANRAVS